MKSLKLLLIILVAGMIAITSCNKTDPHNTPYPDQSMIDLIIDWSNLEEGYNVPDAYTVCWEDTLVEISGKSKSPYVVVDPGIHQLLVYTRSEEIKLTKSNVASIPIISGGTDDNGIEEIVACPGWLLSAVTDEIETKLDTRTSVNVKMKQQLRKLKLVINPAVLTSYSFYQVIDNSATLTGVASQLNLETDVLSTKSYIKPKFILEDSKEFVATVKLLGIIPTEKQVLTFQLRYGKDVGNIEETIEITTDLTDLLASFNDKKEEPLVLKCDLFNLNGTINGWEVVDEGPAYVY